MRLDDEQLAVEVLGIICMIAKKTPRHDIAQKDHFMPVLTKRCRDG